MSKFRAPCSESIDGDCLVSGKFRELFAPKVVAAISTGERIARVLVAVDSAIFQIVGASRKIGVDIDAQVIDFDVFTRSWIDWFAARVKHAIDFLDLAVCGCIQSHDFLSYGVIGRRSRPGCSGNGPRADATDGCADLRASLLCVARQVQIVTTEHVFARVAARARLVAAVVKRTAGFVAAIQIPQISVDAAAVLVPGTEVRSLVSAAHFVPLRVV
ncbi:hypothetical protein WI37_11050 [Burkholderia ubonensis]|nr:hypothetical protein WI37_11050 [Burkholderia ubonensis]